MPQQYIAPSYLEKAFYCPYCGVLSQQKWSPLSSTQLPNRFHVFLVLRTEMIRLFFTSKERALEN